MQKDYLVVITVTVLFIAFAVFMLTGPKPEEDELVAVTQNTNQAASVEDAQPIVYKDLIRVENPLEGSAISSPLTIRGEARGTWYFEATFPVTIVNWDGLIIAEHYAQASSDWMTEEYVPFTSTVTFESPYKAGDPEFMKRGALILRKDNPSGLPQYDDALEISVVFE